MRRPVFELHIVPMIRALDREHMSFWRDLWNYDQVADPENAAKILRRLRNDMPTADSGGPWPDEWISLFERWTQTGFKRLELGKGQYRLTKAGAIATLRATGVEAGPGYRGWLQLDPFAEAARTYIVYLEAPDQPAPGPTQQLSLRERFPASDNRPVRVWDVDGLHDVPLS